MEKQSLSAVRLSLGEKIAFGMGDVAANIYMQIIGVFLLNFYTDVLGITAAAAGIVSMISRIFDALNDFAVGYLADKSARYKKWVLVGSLAAAVLFVAMFLVPDWSPAAKAAYALASFSIWTIAHTIYVIPYNAMASTVTQDPYERTSINSVRFIITTVPVVLVSVLTPLMLSRLGSAMGQGKAYLITTSAFSALALASTLVCVLRVKERVQVRPEDAQKLTIGKVVGTLSKNGPLSVLVGAFFLRNVGYYIFSGAMVYYFKYNLGNETLMSLFMLALVPFSVLGMLVVPPLAKRFGKKAAFFWGGVVMAAAFAGIFLANGNLPVLFACGCIGAAAMAGPLVSSFSMVSDTVEYGKWKTGADVRAINFSVFVFSQTVGISLASFIIGMVLNATGYAANQAQTPLAESGILWLFSLIPAAVTLLMSFAIRFWKLTEARVTQILRELNANEPLHKLEEIP